LLIPKSRDFGIGKFPGSRDSGIQGSRAGIAIPTRSRAVELGFKNLGFLGFFKKPKKPKNPNLGFLGFLILLVYFNSF